MLMLLLYRYELVQMAANYYFRQVRLGACYDFGAIEYRRGGHAYTIFPYLPILVLFHN